MTRAIHRLMWWAALALLPATARAAPPPAGPLVLAAASLQEAMTAEADAFASRGNPRPVVSFAASSALARQLIAGSPADLFISADEDWMDAVGKAGLLRAGSRVTLLTNRLVIVAPAAQPLHVKIAPKFALAAALGTGKLAMADPDSVPAGKYGKAALTSLGVWAAVEPSVARAENVRAALALVSRGSARAGIVYATDARADPGVMVAGVFPPGSHPPITYPVALLAASTNPAAARFAAFLRSASGRAVFRNYGFGTR